MSSHRRAAHKKTRRAMRTSEGVLDVSDIFPAAENLVNSSSDPPSYFHQKFTPTEVCHQSSRNDLRLVRICKRFFRKFLTSKLLSCCSFQDTLLADFAYFPEPTFVLLLLWKWAAGASGSYTLHRWLSEPVTVGSLKEPRRMKILKAWLPVMDLRTWRVNMKLKKSNHIQVKQTFESNHIQVWTDCRPW